MKLESVRELKQILSEKVSPDLERVVTGATSYGVGSRGEEEWPQAVPSFALGASRVGEDDYRLAVRVQDDAFLVGSTLDPLRKWADGEIDIEYVGIVGALSGHPWQRGRCWPLRIGCSVGHPRGDTGTLGCFVRDGLTDSLAALSNNHVLAAQNAGASGGGILQPGPVDGGSLSRDVFAGLTRFVPILPSGNVVDAAIATLTQGSRQDRRDVDGKLSLSGRVATVDVDDVVVKVGRTTGFTRGRVRVIELDNVVVRYASYGLCSFDAQIEIEGESEAPFSRGGDSGSVVLHGNGDAVGLLFAGTSAGGTHGHGVTYANDFARVLSSLGITLDAT